ncbi:hypothetical protein Taro_012347 [Colocasia esculenta]|uniref:RNase H type-1 domain-containing protein n=1 Tax=Colocasia esculenta TaxID=4460 RepID=A0A843UCP5_COLES|nr:hypothetical protein [Colocasia esculenta]
MAGPNSLLGLDGRGEEAKEKRNSWGKGNFGTVLQIHDVTKAMTQTQEALETNQFTSLQDNAQETRQVDSQNMVQVQQQVPQNLVDLQINSPTEGLPRVDPANGDGLQELSMDDAFLKGDQGTKVVLTGLSDVPTIFPVQPVHGSVTNRECVMVAPGSNTSHAVIIDSSLSSSRGPVDLVSVEEGEFLLRVAKENIFMPDLEINREVPINRDHGVTTRSKAKAVGAREGYRCAKRFDSTHKSVGKIIADIKYAVSVAIQGVIYKHECFANSLAILRTFGFKPTVKLKVPKIVRWIPPKHGVCLNIDGACKGNPGPCGGGGCLRNPVGDVLLSFAFFYGHGDSLLVEVRALDDGLRLAALHGFHITSVYSDSLVLVQSFIHDKCPSWKCSWWWRLARSLLQQLHVCVAHSFREANRVADALASYGQVTNKSKKKKGRKKHGSGCTVRGAFLFVPRGHPSCLKVCKTGPVQARVSSTTVALAESGFEGLPGILQGGQQTTAVFTDLKIDFVLPELRPGLVFGDFTSFGFIEDPREGSLFCLNDRKLQLGSSEHYPDIVVLLLLLGLPTTVPLLALLRECDLGIPHVSLILGS